MPDITTIIGNAGTLAQLAIHLKELLPGIRDQKVRQQFQAQIMDLEGKTLDLKRELLDLRGEMLKIEEENVGLRGQLKDQTTAHQNEIVSIKQQHNQTSNPDAVRQYLYLVNNAYRHKGEARTSPAYCVGCYHKSEKLVPLIVSASPKDGICPVCENVAVGIYPDGPPRTW